MANISGQTCRWLLYNKIIFIFSAVYNRVVIMLYVQPLLPFKNGGYVLLLWLELTTSQDTQRSKIKRILFYAAHICRDGSPRMFFRKFINHASDSKIHTEFIHWSSADITWEWIDLRPLLDDAVGISCCTASNCKHGQYRIKQWRVHNSCWRISFIRVVSREGRDSWSVWHERYKKPVI